MIEEPFQILEYFSIAMIIGLLVFIVFIFVTDNAAEEVCNHLEGCEQTLCLSKEGFTRREYEIQECILETQLNRGNK